VAVTFKPCCRDTIQGQALLVGVQFGLGDLEVGFRLEDVLAGRDLLFHQVSDPLHIGPGQGKLGL